MIHRGEIYLVDFCNQIGAEQNGIRPAVIVQNEIGNYHSPTTIVCPLTTKNKPMTTTHVELNPEDCGVYKTSVVLCEQIRVVDKQRLLKRIGVITNSEKTNDINHKLMVAIGIKL